MNIILFERKLVFALGFVLSFITVFLFEYTNYFINFQKIYEDVSNTNENQVDNWSKYEERYEIWRKNQKIKFSKINLDTFYYGAESNHNFKNSHALLEADWLKEKVSITCVVFVKKIKLAITIKDTWGKHCNQLLFFSENLSNSDLPVINLEIKYSSSWQLLCEVMKYIWKKENQNELQWLIFVKDDTFVITENLRFMLAPLSFEQPYYLGHAVVLWGLPYNIAQAGYVLSYKALKRLMQIFDSSEKCAAGGKYWNKEDYYLAKHLAALDIYPSDTRDREKQGTFNGYSLNVLLFGISHLDHYFTRSLYPLSSKCCSNRLVTFNVGGADKMRTINYMLYHLHVFEKGIYGNLPATTPLPDSEVWKLALRDEFNLTDIGEISSEHYFQIWKSKYSEPERFISSFRAKPVSFESNLETHENL